MELNVGLLETGPGHPSRTSISLHATIQLNSHYWVAQCVGHVRHPPTVFTPYHTQHLYAPPLLFVYLRASQTYMLLCSVQTPVQSLVNQQAAVH